MSGKKPFNILERDVELFEQDLGPIEFEYFQKHLEAFKTMWNEMTVKDKKQFVEEFFTYAENYGYIRDIPTKIEIKNDIFIESKYFLTENFATERMSAAKKLVFEIALISENREKFTHGFGSASKTKDPFYNIDTRRTFRKFFGEPNLMITYKKTIITMGLYTRFGGAVCRMLRRWVEGGIPSISGRPVDRISPKKTESKKSKKAEYKKTGDDDDEDTVVITNIDCFKIGDHGQKSQPKDKSTKSEKIKSIQKDLVKAIKDKGFLITAMNPPFDPNNETLTAENFPEGIYDPYEDEKEARRSNEAKSEDLEYTGVKEAGEEHSKSKGQSGFIDWLEGIAGNIQEYNKGALTSKGSDGKGNDGTSESGKLKKNANEIKVSTKKDESTKKGSASSKNQDAKLANNSEKKNSASKNPTCQSTLKDQEKKKRADQGDQAKPTGKRHHCRCCRKIEPNPRTYKKCAWCKGKGTKFYCSKKCQIEDWQACHREEHIKQDDCHG